jgi:hypothetical protein
MTHESKKAGRPTLYTPELAEKICELMTMGNSIKSICALEDMPGETTLYRWLTNNTEFLEKYRAAREVQAESFFEEMIREATDRSGDYFMDGNQPRPNAANVMRSKLIADNLKWVLARMNPKKYGAATELAPSAPQQVSFSFEREIVDPPNILKDRIAELERQLGLREGPPKQIGYDPGPLPQRLDEEIKNRALWMIKRTVPAGDQRPPDAVIDEVFSVCERALGAHFGSSNAREANLHPDAVARKAETAEITGN